MGTVECIPENGGSAGARLRKVVDLKVVEQ